MNCEEFWNRISRMEASELDDHAAGCAPCAARLERERGLSRGLRLLAAELNSLEAPARVEANLAAAFRLVHGIGATPRNAWWGKPILPWAAAAVAAAVLAFGFWIAPKRRAEAPAAHHNAPAQVELATLTSQARDDGFIPLPDAPQIDPNDDVNVIRMELPRSAMLTVGLDVNPDQVSGTVQAEVMLGSDGLARAVRFVE